MRRVPSRLFCAAFVLSLSFLASDGALAGPAGYRASGGHWGGHGGFSRWHGSGSRSGFVHRGHAGHGPAFNGHFSHRFGFHGFGRSPYGYGRSFYPRSVYGYSGYGGYGFGPGYAGHNGRHVYGHQGYNRFGYGHHDSRGFFYGRSGYGHDGYGRRGYGFFPHSTWVWPSDRYADPTIVAEQGAPLPEPIFVPSVAELPVSLGIRSAPVAAPAIYVVGSGKRSIRSGGAKIVSMDRGGPDNAAGSGPRIIRVNAR